MQHRRSCPRISYSTGPRAVCTILLSADTRLVCSSSHLRYCQYSITIARMGITSISNTQDIGVPSLLKLCLDLLISLVTSGCSLGDLPHVGLTQTGTIRVPADVLPQRAYVTMCIAANASCKAWLGPAVLRSGLSMPADAPMPLMPKAFSDVSPCAQMPSVGFAFATP